MSYLMFLPHPKEITILDWDRTYSTLKGSMLANEVHWAVKCSSHDLTTIIMYLLITMSFQKTIPNRCSHECQYNQIVYHEYLNWQYCPSTHKLSKCMTEVFPHYINSHSIQSAKHSKAKPKNCLSVCHYPYEY